MDKILHDPKDPKLWELWYSPYNGSCRILSINRITLPWQALSEQTDFGESPEMTAAVETHNFLLGGSWDLVSMVVSTLSGGISNYKYSYLNYSPGLKVP